MSRIKELRNASEMKSTLKVKGLSNHLVKINIYPEPTPVEILKVRSAYGDRARSHHTSYFESNGRKLLKTLAQININAAKLSNPKLSEDFTRVLTNVFVNQDSDTRSSIRSRNEADLFSSIAINEFLEQSAYETYGEFLNEEWDNCHEMMMKLKFNEYDHTVELFTKNFDILSHRKSHKDSTIELIEA